MITNYNRDDIEKLAKDLRVPNALRDYDILKALKEGKTILVISMEYKISERHIFRIRDKYLK